MLMKQQCWKSIAGFLLIVLLGGITAGILFWNGILLLNNPSEETYPVRGVDVSSYQGKIDWPILAEKGIQFAFLKATEGSGLVDPCFSHNWEGARKTDLWIGAYHFFSFDSPGKTQAENFIETVPDAPGLLPPVVDLEFYGDYVQHPPSEIQIQEELNVLLRTLEAHYEKRPILYATEASYQFLLSEDYETYDIWIRNVLTRPALPDDRDWTFWQYTNRGTLPGYSGEERFIDLNVFCGTQAAFNVYVQSET